MPAPTSMTEAEVRAYMVRILGSTATALSLTASSEQVAAAAEEVDGLLSSGIAGETDIRKLLTLARWQAWELAANATDQYDVQSGDDRLTRSQMMDRIEKRLHAAQLAATAYSEGAGAVPGSQVGIATIAASPVYAPATYSEFG